MLRMYIILNIYDATNAIIRVAGLYNEHAHEWEWVSGLKCITPSNCKQLVMKR